MGRLEVAGGAAAIHAQQQLENVHRESQRHHASDGGARVFRRHRAELWKDQPPDAPKPMVIEQFLPFVSNYEFFDKMGVRIYDNGHSYTGVNFSIHSSYSGDTGIRRANGGGVRCRTGPGHSRRVPPQHGVLSEPDRQRRHTDHSSREAHCRRSNADRELHTAAGRRSPALLERSATYNRLINAPTSVVGHDDLYCYRAIQEGLASDGNEWVSLQRNYSDREERVIAPAFTTAPARVSMRGQFRAWLAAMTARAGGSMQPAAERPGR